MKLQKGDDAPSINAKDQNGETISLKQYEGKKVALYFYPRDLTPTCTTQACNLRDQYQELSDLNIAVIGVNDDPEAKHQKFINKHNLPFPLIADTDHKVLTDYGVWGPKKFMGKVFDGTHRTTFLINEDRKIVDVITKPKAKIHADQIKEGFGL